MYERLAITSNLPNDVEADVPDWTPMLLDSAEMGDGTFEITIKGDRTWTDGDPVTAEDLATQLRIEQYLGQTSGGVWDELTVTDDQTLSLDIGERNPELVASTLLPKPIRFKRDSRFGDWLTQYEEASGEEERESVSEEIVQTKIEETESYGLWRIESISNSRVLMKRYEDHPLSSEVNFDTVEIPSIPSNQKRWQSLSEDRIDALLGSTAPTSIEESFPDHAVRLPYASGAGDAVVFNHGEAPFDDRRVCKAVAFLVNRWTNTHIAKDFVSTIEYPIGLANQEAEQYLGDSLEDFQRYGYKETRGDEATRLLEAAGYSRE
jgi:peptide/nickel transport system substrate-binding protein